MMNIDTDEDEQCDGFCALRLGDLGMGAFRFYPFWFISCFLSSFTFAQSCQQNILVGLAAVRSSPHEISISAAFQRTKSRCVH